MRAAQLNLVAIVLAAVIGGIAGGTGAVWWLQGGSGGTPPVAVINIGGLIDRATAGGASGADAVDTAFDQAKKLGRAFAAEGYLVLDASAVINAPANIYIPERGEKGLADGQ